MQKKKVHYSSAIQINETNVVYLKLFWPLVMVELDNQMSAANKMGLNT